MARGFTDPTIAVQAIDVHGHYGPYRRDGHELLNEFMSGDAETVVQRARRANTRLTIVSPLVGLLPRFRSDPVAGNEEAVRTVASTDGLLQWVLIDPLKPRTYEQAAEMLRLPRCVGIKIHPEEHGYAITDHGRALFEFAAEHKAVVLAHSGEQNSLPEDFVAFANDYPEVQLILAHLGNGWDADPTHQVRGIQASKHGNVYVETSSARSIQSGLIEWAVREVGAERILFGTDTPLYFAPMQRARISHAEICDVDKRRILYGNAVKLLSLENDDQRLPNTQ